MFSLNMMILLTDDSIDELDSIVNEDTTAILFVDCCLISLISCFIFRFYIPTGNNKAWIGR